MIDFLPSLHPVILALLATCFTWAMTALEAATVFLSRDISRKILDTMLGFTGGGYDRCELLVITGSSH